MGLMIINRSMIRKKGKPVPPLEFVLYNHGNPAVAPSAGYSSGIMSIEGTGQSINLSPSRASYALTPIQGDFVMIAHFANVIGGTGTSRAAGIVAVQDPNNQYSRFFSMFRSMSENYMRSCRRLEDWDGTALGSLAADWFWARIRRIGNEISMHRSNDGGMSWTHSFAMTFANLAAVLHVGAFAHSGSNTTTNTAISNFQMTIT
jgi:hypothetical protein